MNEDMNKKSTNEGREKISAYLDDALPQAEIDALSLMDDASVGQRGQLGVASRYQMIGEVLRGQMSDASMIDVHLQVREALHDEKLDVPETIGNVLDNQGADGGRSVFDLISFDSASWFDRAQLNSAWFKPVGGLAVAASVAMIMVITVTNEETTPNSNLDNNLVAESTIENMTTNNASVVSVAVSTSVATSVANETGTPKVDLPHVNLDTYLAEHAEFAAQDTMQGRMPYARAVSYEAE
jgi:negative regulator of sigma E activity